MNLALLNILPTLGAFPRVLGFRGRAVLSGVDHEAVGLDDGLRILVVDTL